MYYLLSIFIFFIIFNIIISRKNRMKWKLKKTLTYNNVFVTNEKDGEKDFLPYGDFVTETENFFVEEHIIDSLYVDEKMSYLAAIPKTYMPEKSYPVLFLLHGLKDCPHDWIAKARLLEHYEKLLKKKAIGNMIIIIPNSGFEGSSFYSDFKKIKNKRYESYFVEELIPEIKENYNIKSAGICGFSMGGYGAFKLGLKHLELFQVIGSFAGAISLVRLSINRRIARIVKFIYIPSFLFKDEDKENFISIFGSWGKDIIKEDPYTLIKNLDKAEQQKKRFYISVGKEDKEPYNMMHQWVDMVGRAKRFNLPYEAHLYTGETHRWEYVSKDLENFLKYSWLHLK